MNPKIKKTRDELERTKAKITELQALVPHLERSVTDMENTEIIKAVRSADIAPADLPAFIASLKRTNAAAPEHAETPAQDEPPTDADGFRSGTITTYEEDEDDV